MELAFELPFELPCFPFAFAVEYSPSLFEVVGWKSLLASFFKSVMTPELLMS